jgi:hypothetical protein
MSGELAPALWGIPVVSGSSERAALFPAPTTDQRVFNKTTGNVERWTGSAWLIDFAKNTGGIFNVKDQPFGAVGDSVTDDTAAIQAAITAAIAAGGKVYLPGLNNKYYKVTGALIATLAAAQSFVMFGDGLSSVIYSTFAGDILTIDGTAVATGRTVPRLADFVIAGSSATQDGVVLNYTHRGTIENVFVIGCGRWAWNFKSCFLNSMHGGGAANNVGAPGNIPTQPIPKGMLRLGDGSMGGGSNANSFHGCCFSGSQLTPTTITGATNASPIVITSANHGLNTGDVVGITGVVGNTAANDAWIITKVDANNFSLQSSAGNGAYVSGGMVNAGVGVHIQATTNSYANSFYGGSAENNAVGALIGPLCTINVFSALDFTSSYAVQYRDQSSATSPSNSFINSGTGGGTSQFGGTTNFYGALRVWGSLAFFQLESGGSVKFNTNDAAHNIFRIFDNRNVAVGDAALATNATNGFFYIQTSAGPPTGVPTALSGLVPIHYDTTNDDYYIYNGGWKKIPTQTKGTWTPADGSGAGLVFTGVTGDYVKEGKKVTVWGTVTYPSTASGASAVISGLPFANGSTNGGGAPSFTDMAAIPMIRTTPSTSNINIYKAGGANATNTDMSLKTLMFTATYYTP